MNKWIKVLLKSTHQACGFVVHKMIASLVSQFHYQIISIIVCNVSLQLHHIPSFFELNTKNYSGVTLALKGQ